jgi:hypothetical protein
MIIIWFLNMQTIDPRSQAANKISSPSPKENKALLNLSIPMKIIPNTISMKFWGISFSIRREVSVVMVLPFVYSTKSAIPRNAKIIAHDHNPTRIRPISAPIMKQVEMIKFTSFPKEV